MLITLEDGRVFPSYEGEALAWNVSHYNSWNEEQQGYPRAKAVLCELSESQLAGQHRACLRASFDRIFGHVAKKMLVLIEAEMKRHEGA